MLLDAFGLVTKPSSRPTPTPALGHQGAQALAALAGGRAPRTRATHPLALSTRVLARGETAERCVAPRGAGETAERFFLRRRRLACHLPKKGISWVTLNQGVSYKWPRWLKIVGSCLAIPLIPTLTTPEGTFSEGTQIRFPT